MNCLTCHKTLSEARISELERYEKTGNPECAECFDEAIRHAYGDRAEHDNRHKQSNYDRAVSFLRRWPTRRMLIEDDDDD